MASSIAWFGNLPNNTTEDQLKALVAKSGSVTAVELGRLGRMAWVTFASPAQAEAACKLAGQDFNGRELKVEVATRDPTAPREPRERKPAAERKPREPRAPRAAAASGEERPPPKTYSDRVTVRGLPREVTQEAVTAFFAPCGAIKKVRVSRLASEVVFETAEAAAAAVAKTDATFPGSDRTVRVYLSVKKSRKPARKAAAEGEEAEAKPRRERKEAGAGRKRTEEREPVPETLVWVGGLAAGADEASVKRQFSSYGGIVEVSVRAPAPERTFAYITFADAAAADKAVASPKDGLKVQKATRVPRPVTE